MGTRLLAGFLLVAAGILPGCSRNDQADKQTYELQCLGIVLGDALVQDMGMEWIMVEDEYGRDPAVRLPNTTIILYPLTIISKRIERGEEVDVFDLYNGAVAQVEALKGIAK